MKRREQLYGRGGKMYYWSPEDGDVCVDLKFETPAMITLWRCDSNEPFRAIRRGEPLWKKVVAVVHGDPQKHVSILSSGPAHDIYMRDGKIYYWDMVIGEKLARPEFSRGLDAFHLLGVPGLMVDRETNLGGKLAQLMGMRNPSARPTRSPRTQPRRKSSQKPQRKPQSRKTANVRTLVAKALR